MKYIFVFFTFFTTLSGGYSQVITDIKPDTTTLKEFEQRIKLTRIDGKYIPKDLNDAMMELNKIMEDGAKKKFAEMSENDARQKTHFSFGKYINARWYIQEGSRLTIWFQKNKIYDFDDMIDCIIVSYHRTLNNKPIEFEILANYYYKKQMKKVKKLVEDKKKREVRVKLNEKE
mgnify:CR=1 FL=1